MTGICAIGEWIERANYAGVVGATAASLKRSPERPGIETRLMTASETWRIGVDVPVAAATARGAERFEEEPERWDGLS
jgi:hypothetical protein